MIMQCDALFCTSKLVGVKEREEEKLEN